jgi:acyl-coenzyme A thioesterase PaaI-like protein
MKYIYSLIDKMLLNPSSFNLIALDKILRLAIPFNAPHGFKLKKLNSESVIISLPNKKLNHNHLGGVHACAMATVGEYCAGMSLLTMFGISKYRLILSELNVKYTYQGRVDLEGVCSPQQINVTNAQTALEKEGKYLQELKTTIQDLQGREVAIVTTVWQLKEWGKVKTKPINS